MSESDYSDFEVGDTPNPTDQQLASMQDNSQLNNNTNNNNEPQNIQSITQAASAMAAAMAAQQLLASAVAICGIDLASLTNLAALAGQPAPINAPEQLMAAAVAAAAFLSPNSLVPEDLSVAQQQLQLQQQQQQHQQQQQQQQSQQAPQHQAAQHRASQVQQVQQHQQQGQQQPPAAVAATNSLMNVAAGLSINAVPNLLQHHQQLQQHLAQQQQQVQNFHQHQQQQHQQQQQHLQQHQNNQNHANHLHSAAKHHHSLGGHHHHSSIQTQQQLLATKGFNPMAVVHGQQTDILTPTHLRKAKLMFFYVRYPNSSTLKECFRDVRFNKNNTAQLVKWFSNFREFYYIQMEKFAREAINDLRIKCKEDIVVSYDHELINQLNNHYNKNRHIELPEVFRVVVEETLRHFFDAIHHKRDQEQSWKKAIYKLIARLDQEVPDLFKSEAFNEHLE